MKAENNSKNTGSIERENIGRKRLIQSQDTGNMYAGGKISF